MCCSHRKWSARRVELTGRLAITLTTLSATSMRRRCTTETRPSCIELELQRDREQRNDHSQYAEQYEHWRPLDLHFDPELVEAFIATVQNFQVIDAVSNDMFSDTTHLDRYHGAVAFTEFLAEQYGELLRD
jgi:hypothetical protein